MNEIIKYISEFIASDIFQGVVALISSTAFITLIGVIGKLFGNKRLNAIIGQLQEALDKSDEKVAALTDSLTGLEDRLAKIDEEAMTTKEMTKTYVLNSKAAASTKNEILRLDATPLTGDQAVVVVDKQEVTQYTDEPVEKTEVDEIDELVNKL